MVAKRAQRPIIQPNDTAYPQTPRGHAVNSDVCHVVFPPVDIRPQTCVVLDTMFLVAEADIAGSTITGRWTATSKATKGVQSGTIEIAINEDVLSLEDALALKPHP
jgi:hypothetical protein